MYITIGVIAVLLLLAISAWTLSESLSELPSFMYILLGAMVLLIGAAMYLSFAVPSYANTSSFIVKEKKAPNITQDDMIGLELIEE